MLHELLLALSGHPSPLLLGAKVSQQLLPLLSPSEEALLRSIACLGNLHVKIKKGTSTITRCHPSVVCRAVAQAITSVHLAGFQQEILRVEQGILQEDASLVGAYEIVPLSSISVAFGGWRPKLEWLKELVQQMQPPSSYASGAQVINWLRKELQTGFPDIQSLATKLVQVAESTWLRQISAWVLYATLPTLGADDFLIQRRRTSSTLEASVYELKLDLAPGYVTQATANSILFIGKSLEYVRQDSRNRDLQVPAFLTGQAPLISIHLKHLSHLVHPINSTSFSGTILAIRSSLSRNVLQRLLPLSDVYRAVNMLHEYFLLERGEFTMALIAAADDCLSARQKRGFKEPVSKDTHRLGGVMIKEGEVTAVLARTWTTLAALQDIDDDVADEELELARSLVCLSIKRNSATQTRISFMTSLGPLRILENVRTTFDDILLATPTYLTLKAGSPLDLFLNNSEVDAYSSIHSYLLAIRRAHLHLTELWKLSTLRKTRASHDRELDSNGHSKKNRDNVDQRNRSLRSTWAMVGSVVFLLAELGEYLQGEVLKNSRGVFTEWLKPSQSTISLDDRGSIEGRNSTNVSIDFQSEAAITHDPESLTLAHRSYLTSLIHSLLMDDPAYTKSLKTLMTRIDYITALIRRLSIVQLNLNIGDNDAAGSAHFDAEERELMNNLAQVRIGVEDDLQALVKRLRDIDFERLGSGIESLADDLQGTSFVPWKDEGLYRLLMKLDFAGLRISVEDYLRG
ncbi:hypothetical protein MMC18_007783 [Xylographa bjoerkii]|nr:hypothetical protein [Xylographa bjoerkii]